MKATCTSCGKPFLFADDRFGERPSVRVKCPSCQTVVTLARPGSASPAGETGGEARRGTPAPAPPAGPAPAPVLEPEPAPLPSHEAEGSSERTDRPTLKLQKKDLLGDGGEEEHMRPMPRGLRVSVALLSGPETGKVLPCKVSRAVIGRAGSDLPINDEEISRRHAVVEIHDDRYFLRDLGSTNGTFVDERRITETEIFDRSEFRVGATNCMLIVASTDEL